MAPVKDRFLTVSRGHYPLAGRSGERRGARVDAEAPPGQHDRQGLPFGEIQAANQIHREVLFAERNAGWHPLDNDREPRPV